VPIYRYFLGAEWLETDDVFADHDPYTGIPAFRAAVFLRAVEIVERRSSETADILARETSSEGFRHVSAGHRRSGAPAGGELGISSARRGSPLGYSGNVSDGGSPAARRGRELCDLEGSERARLAGAPPADRRGQHRSTQTVEPRAGV